jgi:Ca2+-binding RTX toxin-like protein
VSGTPAADKIKVAPNGTGHVVTGLTATVTIATTDPGQKVVVDGGEGDDTIDASTMTKDKTQPFLSGGPGQDFLLGSPGQDVIAGGTGVDVALLLGGLDTFTWAAGDGNDIVEGGAGTDFLSMDGSAANDTFSVMPVGSRARATLGIETVDLGDVERFDVLPGAGADLMRVADMSGTDVTHVEVMLTVARGSTVRDNSPDSVRVDGTNGIDKVSVTSGGPFVRAAGLAAVTTVGFGEPALDHLHVDTKLGNDLLSVEPLVHQQLLFTSS